MQGRKSSKDIADMLAARAEDPKEISVAEFRRWFLMGLGAIVRETDATSYNLKKLNEKVGGGR